MSKTFFKENFTNFIQTPKPNLTVYYSFSFVSLIPFFTNSPIDYPLTTFSKVKLVFKKSYLLATWLYYLRLTIKEKPDQHSKNMIKINILPTKLKLYTFQKAPMAHKTNSQEHFKFKFCYFNLVFKTFILPECFLKSLNISILFFLLSKPLFPVFETNLLFLKSYKLLFHFSDKNFFSYI